MHQCLRSSADAGREVARILLTASGGPFRGRTAAELADVGVDEALAHPTWSMGPKITIDSSTLMNKGLEVIEAHELFGMPYDEIEVVVHPQSIVHSMVEFTDGSTIAQLSLPDMRLPIGYALGYPDRIGTPFGRIDWAQLERLDFEPPDLATFRCLALAYEAGRAGGTRPGLAERGQRGRRRGVPRRARSAGTRSPRCATRPSTGMMQGCRTTVDDVVAADRAARMVAREQVLRDDDASGDDDGTTDQLRRRAAATTASATR